MPAAEDRRLDRLADPVGGHQPLEVVDPVHGLIGDGDHEILGPKARVGGR